MADAPSARSSSITTQTSRKLVPDVDEDTFDESEVFTIPREVLTVGKLSHDTLNGTNFYK